MMAETPPRPPRTDADGDSHRDAHRRRRRQGRAAQHVIGLIYLAFAVSAAVFALATWWVGKLNPINLLVFALTIAGTAPVGLLAWQGDYLGARSMDEGQREMSRAAQSDAFYVAYLGLYALFFGYLYFPQVRDAIPVLIGALLLVVTLTWVVGYTWRRWRPL
jgi:hypothetical protein